MLFQDLLTHNKLTLNIHIKKFLSYMEVSKFHTREGNSSSYFRVLKISLYERSKKDDQIRKYEKISIISFNLACLSKHDIKKLHMWFENKNLNVQHSQKDILISLVVLLGLNLNQDCFM